MNEILASNLNMHKPIGEVALSVAFGATSPEGRGANRLSPWESSREAGERACPVVTKFLSVRENAYAFSSGRRGTALAVDEVFLAPSYCWSRIAGDQ